MKNWAGIMRYNMRRQRAKELFPGDVKAQREWIENQKKLTDAYYAKLEYERSRQVTESASIVGMMAVDLMNPTHQQRN